MWLSRCLSNLDWIKEVFLISQMLKLQNFNRLREILIDNTEGYPNNISQQKETRNKFFSKI